MRSAFLFQGDSLQILYLDESGHSHDPSSDFFVLAGFSIFERQTHWLEAQLLQRRALAQPTLENRVSWKPNALG